MGDGETKKKLGTEHQRLVGDQYPGSREKNDEQGQGFTQDQIITSHTCVGVHMGVNC